MQPVSDIHQKEFSRLEKIIKDDNEFFQQIYEDYNKSFVFVLKSGYTDIERGTIIKMGKTDLESNVLYAEAATIIGEFQEQEPGVEITSDSYDSDNLTVPIIKCVESHIKHVVSDDESKVWKGKIIKDLVIGGFAVAKVAVDYINDMSLKQTLQFKRCNPTLCFFDKFAQEDDKSDGNHCGEIIPLGEEEFKSLYPNEDMKNFTFSPQLGEFSWSYFQGSKKVILVCDFYEKKKKHFSVVLTTENKEMKLEDYNKLIDNWSDDFSVPPGIIGKPIRRFKTIIRRYRLIKNKVIETEETDYNALPLTFFSGAGSFLKNTDKGEVSYFCPSYLYYANGMQRLKNYALNAIAGAAENVVSSKFILKKEALPKEQGYLQGLLNPQLNSHLVVNAFVENDPEQPIPDPIIPVEQQSIPQEVLEAFRLADPQIKMALGKTNVSIGNIQDQSKVSGSSIVETALLANSAAVPFLNSFINGLRKMCQDYVNLMPKVYTTPRTIPVKTEDGKSSYVFINGQKPQTFNYDYNVLNVKVTVGASSKVQKARTLQVCKDLMSVNPSLSELFGATPGGVNFLLDNMDARHIEELREMIPSFLQQQQQQKQKMQEMQMQQLQNNPAILKNQIEIQRLKMEQMENERKFQLEMKKLEMEEIKIKADLIMTHQDNATTLEKAHLDHTIDKADILLKGKDQAHKHVKESLETIHKVTRPEVKPKIEKEQTQ